MTSLRAMALFYLIRNFEYAYGYDRQGRLYFADPFPDALKKLYSGKQGWVYTCESGDYEKTAIPNEYISRTPVRVTEAAFVPDAYAAFLEEERAGNILLYDYSRTAEDPAALAWLDKEIGGTICAERLWQEPDAAKRAFFPCMQQQNGARLMQYCPTFFCPGNHEVDDFRVGTDPVFTWNADNWHFSIFMQIFRPLYPKADYSLSGKRWYSADYGDLHLVSLSIQRWALWGAYEAPGWRLVDPISPNSPQIRWLTDDLAACRSKYRWVIQHWHILNKGTDVQPNLCQPQLAEDGSVSYPDDGGSALMALYSRFGVNAVTFGHSHVYERYYYHGCHYIEAAYLGVCCRERNAPLHPSRLQPLVEDNSRQSFLIVDCDESGLHARGFYSAEAPILFDEYQIADADGKTVAPAL